MKYKVGDKVRVLDKLQAKKYGGCYFDSCMLEYRGCVGTITHAYLAQADGTARYHLDISGAWNFTDEMIEPLGNYAIINGNRFDLTADQLRALGYEVKPKFDIELHNELSSLLWQFAIDNGGVPDVKTLNNHLLWKHDDGGVKHIELCGIGICEPRFISKEIAQRAIDEIVTPFLAAHPDFRW